MVELIGKDTYKIDWGLQYVMSIEDKAKYDQQLALLGQALSASHTLDEVRIKQGGVPMTQSTSMTEAICKKHYDITKQTFAN